MGAPAVKFSLPVNAITRGKPTQESVTKKCTIVRGKAGAGFLPRPEESEEEHTTRTSFNCPSIIWGGLSSDSEDSASEAEIGITMRHGVPRPYIQVPSRRTSHGLLSLRLWVNIVVGGESFGVKALVDTGAEINVIQTGIVPTHLTTKNPKAVTMTAADNTVLTGGELGVSATLVLEGADADQGQVLELHCPIHFVQAKITAEAIISYGWLAEQGMLVDPRRHGLRFRDKNRGMFIQGEKPIGKNAPPPLLDRLSAVQIGVQQVDGDIGNVDKTDLPPLDFSAYDHQPQPNRIPASSRKEKGKERRKHRDSKGTPSASASTSVTPPSLSRPAGPAISGETAASSSAHPPPAVTAVSSPRDRPYPQAKPLYPPVIPKEWTRGCSPLRMLDLFSGTGSIARIFRERGYQVVSVDINPSFKPDVVADLLSWNYWSYEPGYFDVVAASPPCTE